MANFERSVNASQEETYSLVDKIMKKRYDFHVTHRNVNRSILAEGGKDYNPTSMAIGMAIGVIFIFLFFPISIIVFLILVGIYVSSGNNLMHFDFRPNGGSLCDLAVTANGRDAERVAQLILDKLMDAVNGPEMMTEVGTSPDNL